jgi:hypothetical protein
MTWGAGSGATTATWTADSGATTATYSGITDATPPWMQLSAVTDTDVAYTIGVDFQLKARSQYPLKVSASRPLKIVTSAYSTRP